MKNNQQIDKMWSRYVFIVIAFAFSYASLWVCARPSFSVFGFHTMHIIYANQFWLDGLNEWKRSIIYISPSWNVSIDNGPMLCNTYFKQYCDFLMHCVFAAHINYNHFMCIVRVRIHDEIIPAGPIFHSQNINLSHCNP